MTEAPWTVRRDDLDRLRAVGLSDEGMVQAVTIGGIFNYVTRVADGVGIEFDYESALPRLQVDTTVEALPRPDIEAWPTLNPTPELTLHHRPSTEAAFARWREHAFERDAPLGRRDRAVLGRAAAFAVCDGDGVRSFADAAPGSPREIALAAYATKLTLTPWRMTEADLGALREEGLDDAGILDVVSVVALQNTLSRIRLALGAPG
jgi:alkylhydroperoxidase family enzyme